MVDTTYHIPGAPRIALLADLHNRPYSSVISSVAAHHPSIICICGDVVYGGWPEGNRSPIETQLNVLPFFRACVELAPTFFSLGNHERRLDRADLAAIHGTGVVLLDNNWVSTVVDDKAVVIGGLTSAYVTDYRKIARRTAENRYPKMGDVRRHHIPETAWLRSFSSQPGYRILLSHHPSYISYIPENVDLILSGHLHGSQWRYYSFLHHEWRGVFNPDEGWFPTMSKGVYGRIVISAGLSNTGHVPRICNPTEIVYID